MKQKLKTLVRSSSVGAMLVLLPLAAGSVAPKQLLISLSETGTSSPIGAASPLADSKMMMPSPFIYNYVAGESLSDETSTGAVYQLQLTGNPQEILKSVASALGIEGRVTESQYSSAEYPAYAVGPQDGSGPSATINWSGTGSWWYNNPRAYPNPDCLKFETADDGSRYCVNYAEQKPTPELLPSKAEMIAEAVKIFSATGQKVKASDIETSTGEWGASAYSSLKIGGQDSPIEWSINWGSNGLIGSVSGNSVVATSKGEFATISDREAVSRMNDWRYSGQLAQSVWAKYQNVPGGKMIAYDGAASTEPSPDGSASPGVEPQPEPTPVTITVDKAEKAQVMIWDKSGRAWVVPGLILFGQEGWITPVFTLVDGLVELPEPVEVSPLLK